MPLKSDLKISVVVVFKDVVIVWFASYGSRSALLFLLRPSRVPLYLTDGSPTPNTGHYLLKVSVQVVSLSLAKLGYIDYFLLTFS